MLRVHWTVGPTLDGNRPDSGSLRLERRRPVENFTTDFDLDIEQVLAHAVCVDVDAKTGGVWRANLAIAIARQLVGRERLRHGLRRRRIFAQAMLGEARVGL